MALLRFRDDVASELTPVALAALAEASTGNQPLAVRIEPGEDVRVLAPVIDRLALVELSFPKYRDGRNYSSARILRDELGYRGELRAVGDVLVDQVHYMRRCGFDSLALADGVSVEAAERALARYAHAYQVASDSAVPVWKQRLLNLATRKAAE